MFVRLYVIANSGLVHSLHVSVKTFDVVLIGETAYRPIGTASAKSVESDLGSTSRIYFDNVTLTSHNVTLTSQKPRQNIYYV